MTDTGTGRYWNTDAIKVIEASLHRLGKTPFWLTQQLKESTSFLNRLKSGERRITISMAGRLIRLLKPDRFERARLMKDVMVAIKVGRTESSGHEDEAEMKKASWRLREDLGRLAMDLAGIDDDVVMSMASIDIVGRRKATVVRIRGKDGPWRVKMG